MTKPIAHKARKRLLKPLTEVFISRTTLDSIIRDSSIRELLDGVDPQHNGVILHGPQGTGKNSTLEAIAKVYDSCGAYIKRYTAVDLNSVPVEDLANYLRSELDVAITEAISRKRPSFVYFDQTSILLICPNSSDPKFVYFKNAQDVLKIYIDKNKLLVIGIATELSPDLIDPDLFGYKRLAGYEIGYPTENRLARMWRYFAGLYELADLTNRQAISLARLTPPYGGATMIAQFCQDFPILPKTKRPLGLDHLSRPRIPTRPKEVTYEQMIRVLKLNTDCKGNNTLKGIYDDPVMLARLL